MVPYLRAALRPLATVTLATGLLAAYVALPASAQEKAEQEAKKTPKGSTELVVTGCLKGRVFTVTGNPEEGGEISRGPDVRGRSFRVAGKKDVIEEVKRNNGHLVEVVGLVRTSDLAQPAGWTVGRTKVSIGLGANPNDPMAHNPAANVVVMDVSAVRFVAETCPIRDR